MIAAEPYSALAAVYDRWMSPTDHARWAAFVGARLRRELGSASEQRRLLDLCCGTGAMTAALQAEGFRVTGLDRSEPMLDQARAALPPGTELVCADLPDVDPATIGTGYDGAVCTFDSINYLVEDGAIGRLFGLLRAVLRPGGLVVVDMNTPHKLRDVFGASHYGDDLGSFAYVWRNRPVASTSVVEFLITLFVRNGERFERTEERHAQRWFSDEEIRAAAAGFTVLEVTDDYTDEPAQATTLRQTWVLQAPAAVVG